MVDYHAPVMQLLAQANCQRLEHIGDGTLTGLLFNVEASFPSLKAANEVLTRAGIGPVLRPTREKP
jgi:hypothetical protein